MTIPEACGLWIEQQIQAELDANGETGASLRKIGRKVAAEVEKYFEVRVNPRTIEKKAERINATNVAPQENATNTDSKPELEKLEKTEPKHGGAREGAGRKPKEPALLLRKPENLKGR